MRPDYVAVLSPYEYTFALSDFFTMPTTTSIIKVEAVQKVLNTVLNVYEEAGLPGWLVFHEANLTLYGVASSTYFPSATSVFPTVYLIYLRITDSLLQTVETSFSVLSVVNSETYLNNHLTLPTHYCLPTN